jgi:O-antigen/teichoic acid export membrane protein
MLNLLDGTNLIFLAFIFFASNSLFNIGLILIGIYKFNTQFIFSNLDFSLIPRIFEFSFYIFINLVIEQILWNTDKLILGYYLGLLSVGIYSISSIFVDQFKLLSLAISNVFIPTIYKIITLNKENYSDHILKIMVKIGRIQLVILFLFYSGFVLFGHEFILLWLGVKFIESYSLIVIVLPFVLIPIIQNIGIEVLKALNKHRFRSLVYFGVATLNIFLTINLVVKIGIIGSIISTSISIFIGHILIMNLYYHYRLNLNMVTFWTTISKLFPAMFMSFIIGIFINFIFDDQRYLLFNPYFNLIFKILIFSFFYVFVLVMFGLNNYEKKLLFDNKFFIFLRGIIK